MSKQYIVFKLEQESFAASIDQVVSITDAPGLSRVPNAPSYVEGLMNLRGDVIPVINLKRRFQIVENHPSRRILISRVEGLQIGYLVDDASQSMTKQEAEVLAPPSIAVQRNNDYLSEVAIDGSGLILVVDLHRVLSPDEYRELGEQKFE